jgi:serine/threonine protein kinase
MLKRLKSLHTHGFVHNDLKPENFLTGSDASDRTIYLIDFGLSKRYWRHSTNQHTPFVVNSYLTGTARYASLNSHLGYSLSRRDDLESM